jgi:hypothetical protein
VTGPTVPDVATCVVCDVVANTSQLVNSRFPDDGFRWVCRDFHACARNVAAAHDLNSRRALHGDLAPEHGPFASPRHLKLRKARMRDLIEGDP